MSRTKQSVQRQLESLRANLDVIEEKIALYTELEAPVHLITERERTKEGIAELKALLETGSLPDEAPTPVMGNAPPLPPRYVPREELTSLRNLKTDQPSSPYRAWAVWAKPHWPLPSATTNR
jgi:hypothetical protein